MKSVEKMRLYRERESQDTKPDFPGKCWAKVRRYVGSVYPQYTDCQRDGVVKSGDRAFCRQHAKQRGLL